MTLYISPVWMDVCPISGWCLPHQLWVSSPPLPLQAVAASCLECRSASGKCPRWFQASVTTAGTTCSRSAPLGTSSPLPQFPYRPCPARGVSHFFFRCGNHIAPLQPSPLNSAPTWHPLCGDGGGAPASPRRCCRPPPPPPQRPWMENGIACPEPHHRSTPPPLPPHIPSISTHPASAGGCRRMTAMVGDSEGWWCSERGGGLAEGRARRSRPQPPSMPKMHAVWHTP